MGATRPASGIKEKAHTPNKGSQTVLITLMSVSLCLNARDEAAEKTDAGRIASISACVFYQIDRLKSGFEDRERTVMPGNCALMGATRLASGHFSAALGRVAPISACVFSDLFYKSSKKPQWQIAQSVIGAKLVFCLQLILHASSR